MTQEEIKLLISDLCCRLPYGVKASIKYWSYYYHEYKEDVFTVKTVDPSMCYLSATSEQCSVEGTVGQDGDFEIRPYLFPISSITEEQWKEITDIQIQESLKSLDSIDDSMSNPLFSTDDLKTIEWCYANYIDIHNLIPMGLAIDATGLNIY